MCGRYGIVSSPETLRARFGATNPLPDQKRDWDDLAPPQSAPVIRRQRNTGERRIDLLRWGLTPSFIADPKGGRQPITAPAETVATSGMFRYAFAQQRCLVPADLFYEWREHPDGKRLLAFGPTHDAPFALAGLWEVWEAPNGAVIHSYAIVTVAATAIVNGRSDRMPVILDESDWPKWLGEVKGEVTNLLRPAREGVARVRPGRETMAA